jgi:hypothetical protein
MKGKELIFALKRKLRVSTDVDLAVKLGMTPMALNTWKNKKKDLSPLQIANAIDKSAKAEVKRTHASLIRPIVEFFPLDATDSRGGAKYELFPTSGDEANPQHVELRTLLGKTNGIYVFYDTRGRAIYAGKAKAQSLWGEMKSVFNRDRGRIQSVYRVQHPKRRQKFKPAHIQPRQPKRTQLHLSDLAAYVSIYEVDPQMINGLEALLVRGFANDLLNARMEKFSSK